MLAHTSPWKAPSPLLALWAAPLKISLQLRLPPCLEIQVPQANSPSTRHDFIEKTQTYWANPHPALTVLLQKLFYLPFTATFFASSSLDNSTTKASEGEKNLPHSFSLQYISSGFPTPANSPRFVYVISKRHTFFFTSPLSGCISASMKRGKRDFTQKRVLLFQILAQGV